MNDWEKEKSRVWFESYKLTVMAEAQGLKLSEEFGSYSETADNITAAWEKRFPYKETVLPYPFNNLKDQHED